MVCIHLSCARCSPFSIQNKPPDVSWGWHTGWVEVLKHYERLTPRESEKKRITTRSSLKCRDWVLNGLEIRPGALRCLKGSKVAELTMRNGKKEKYDYEVKQRSRKLDPESILTVGSHWSPSGFCPSSYFTKHGSKNTAYQSLWQCTIRKK